MNYYIRYELIIGLGGLLFVGGTLNGLGITAIHSDFFWAIAGMGLVIEGLLARREFKKLKALGINPRSRWDI